MKRDKVKFFAFFLASRFKYKYTLEFPTSSGVIMLYARTHKRPSMSVDIEMPYNNGPWVPGKTNWEPLPLRIIDAYENSSKEQKLEFRDWVLNPPADNQGYAISAAKKEIKLCIYDPKGVLLEQFILFGSFVNKYEIDEIFMGNDNVIDCDITVNMAKCLMVF